MGSTHPDMCGRCSNFQHKTTGSEYASTCELQLPENATKTRTHNRLRTPTKRELILHIEEKISSHKRHSYPHAPLGSSYSYVNCLHWDPVKRSMERKRCKTYEYVYTRIKLLPRHVYNRILQVNNHSTRE